MDIIFCTKCWYIFTIINLNKGWHDIFLISSKIFVSLMRPKTILLQEMIVMWPLWVMKNVCIYVFTLYVCSVLCVNAAIICMYVCMYVCMYNTHNIHTKWTVFLNTHTNYSPKDEPIRSSFGDHVTPSCHVIWEVSVGRKGGEEIQGWKGGGGGGLRRGQG